MKTFFFNNLGMKVIALLLAIVSWHAIRQTISFETTISDIPIEIKVGSGWAVLDQSDSFAEVVFRGSQEDIRQIDNKQLKVALDLSADSVAGPMSTNITPNDVKGARSVRIIGVKPDHVRVSLDREAEKLVPVNSRAIGKPFYGEVEQIICEPAAVFIRGPARQLARTDWVSTEPVDVENRVQSFTKRSHVLPPSAVQPYHIEPPDVLVHVIITEKSESLEWKNLPVLAVVRPGSTLKAEINPSRVNVKVTGRADTLGKMTNTIPKVFIDCIDLDQSLAYDLPVNIHLMTGLDVSASADPAFVRVVIGTP